MADKKLARSANKKIAGVCGGLAEYFGMDASILRIVWLLCVLFGGFGLLAYLIM
jgi:phage shock protein PspC (stress-responsive transcriptional regulator)